MEKQEILALVKEQLPLLLEENSELAQWVERLTAQRYADRQQTESHFDMLLGELRRDREEQSRKWAELKAESDRKWSEGKAQFQAMHEEIMAIAKKHDRSIGALGSRWGLQSERAFRDALAAILEASFGVQVVNYVDYDETGEVFGQPDQIELDALIFNGTVILVEMKSSIDKAGMYIFERKVRFYEKRNQRPVDRMIVISPMIDHRAAPVAEKLGIETYGDSIYVPQKLDA